MPIVLGDTTITGLAAGGLPAGVVTGANFASGAVTADKFNFTGTVLQFQYQQRTGRIAGSNSFDFSTSTISATRGTKFLEVSITPLSSSSIIIITVNVPVISETSNHSNYVQHGIWVNDTGAPIALGHIDPRYQDNGQVPGGGSNHIVKLFMSHSLVNSSTSARTYGWYAGWAGGAATINGCGSENSYGGQESSLMTVMEISA